MKSILKLTIPAFLLVSVLSCCSDDEKGIIDLNFKLTDGEDAFVMFDNYEYPTGEKFFISKISMFLSDISVDNVNVSESAFIDLTSSHATTALAEVGYRLSIPSVPVGDYSEISFGIGVNAENNSKVPGDFETDNPLARPGEYWSGWSSFVFYKIEGLLDSDNDGEFETGLSLHIGGDEIYEVSKWSKAISVDANETITLEFALDINDVFQKEGVLYDIVNNPDLHSKANHLDQMNTLITNTRSAITLK